MNNVEKKLDELIELIGAQEEVIRYKQIEKELANNQFVQEKIARFKKVQQKMAIYEHHNNKISDEVQKKYNELYDELFDIPIYNEYITLQEEINELLQQITSLLEKELNTK